MRVKLTPSEVVRLFQHGGTATARWDPRDRKFILGGGRFARRIEGVDVQVDGSRLIVHIDVEDDRGRR